VIAQLPHTEEIIPAVPSTCTEHGLTEGKRCTVCKTVTLEQTAAPLIPHNEETIQGTPATCTETGLTDGKRCTVCKTVTRKQTVIDTIPHTEEIIPAVPSTCTEHGLTEGKRCTVCKTVTLEQTAAPLIPHVIETIQGIPATCTETGLTDGKRCTVCKTVTRQQTVIDTIPHTEEIIRGTPATCTETGLADKIYCTVCKTVIQEQTEIKALGHNADLIEETPSTCYVQGNREYWHCTRCKQDYAEKECATVLTQEDITYPLADHPYKQCFNNTSHYKVATCGHDLGQIDSLEHNFTDNVCADCGFCDYGIYYALNDDGASYRVSDRNNVSKYPKDVEIYGEYNGLPVTEIATNAFSADNIYKDTITSVKIPASVSVINERAFSNCNSLETITVDEYNPTYSGIGNCIIEKSTRTLTVGCKNSVIPTDSSVISIGNYAFYDCEELTEITIPYAVTRIGIRAFAFCGNLTEVIIPDRVTYIGEYAFYSCDKLARVTIPASLNDIG
ncbi:MAG: leucine-rich repeat domain-containing protein, partial [Clostridia bacterium]|nr:leucine-rich repeat domain-containing protein [Clostridia bacterium]